MAEAEQTIRDMRKVGRSYTKRAADLQAELLTKLDVAELQAKVFVPTLLFSSSCVSSLFLLASFYPFHLILYYKADEKYRTKLEETTMENKRRRRQAEAKCEACQKEINEAMEKQKVIRQETRDKTRQDNTRQDKTRTNQGQDKTRLYLSYLVLCCLVLHAHEQSFDTLMNKTKQDKTRQDKRRQEKTRQDKTRQDKTRQGKTTRDNTRQDDTGQDKTRQTTQDKTRQTRQKKRRTGVVKKDESKCVVINFLRPLSSLHFSFLFCLTT